MKAMLVRAPGGPEAMTWTDIDLAAPAAGEALVRHSRIGVNFIDVYYRSGLYPWPSDTLVPGAEAVGVVEAVGPGVTEVKPGDRVCYVTRFGAYCAARVMPVSQLVTVPEGIADDTVASMLLKGLTAHYLVTSSYKVEPGDVVLVHAAAGGVGLILGQWLRSIGAIAIGTAGTDEKVALALAHGYSHVVNYRQADFVAAVADLTEGAGCAVVYDSVGADTWRGSLKCLRKRGMFVSFGQSSGMIRDFQLSDLASHGSISANRPVLFDYVEQRTELVARVQDLFRLLASGAIAAGVATAYPLEQAAQAHRMLEGRQTTGSTILCP
jgi:NADPH2:quinone reductase